MGVIPDSSGRILLSRRADNSHQGGLWEFPGGKLEPGETPLQALKREIREELGLEVLSQSPVIRIKHRYPDCSVLLDVYRITRYSGVPKGIEGQPLAWLAPESMPGYPMPAADRPIVTALRLPDSYLITDPDFGNEKNFLERFREKLAEGQRLVQLRAPGLGSEQLRRLTETLADLCRPQGVRLLLNSTPEMAMSCGADGVHLTARRLMSIDQRPLPEGRWVAASCHNIAELRQAERARVDFVVLSPVLPTATHPDAKPLGWQGFQALVEEVNIPVYALGGMAPHMIGQARRCGGQGVAAIRGFWE